MFAVTGTLTKITVPPAVGASVERAKRVERGDSGDKCLSWIVLRPSGWGPLLYATHHLAMSPHRHALLTIRNLTPRNTDKMFKHECDYSEENSFPRNTHGSIREKDSGQREVEEKLDRSSVVPRISAYLLRERK